MKKYFIAAVLSFAANSALAGACDNSTEADIPLFEEAKTDFLTGRFQKFADDAGAYFPDLQSNYPNYFGAIEQRFPNGFDRCVTILQRREAPGFYQELVFYFEDGLNAPITLLLIGAGIGSDTVLIEFTFNSNISTVMEELK